jgi:hypothetical protein
MKQSMIYSQYCYTDCISYQTINETSAANASCMWRRGCLRAKYIEGVLIMKKILRNILVVAAWLVFALFWAQLVGKIYSEPLCKRYGETFGYTYTGHTYGAKARIAECRYLDANGQAKKVRVGEIPKQFSDYVLGALQYTLLIAGCGGSGILAWSLCSFKDRDSK